MDNIKIDSGVKRITVNGDETRVIEFNPEDILFIERFYGLMKKFEEKEKEFVDRSEEITKVTEKDTYGIPVNTGEQIKLVSELCTYLKAEIDEVFGKGTSKAAFGDMQTLNMFEQFFSGISPFVHKARAAKVDKYRKVPAKKK